jgi:hypothetical protein
MMRPYTVVPQPVGAQLFLYLHLRVTDDVDATGDETPLEFCGTEQNFRLDVLKKAW